MGISEVMYAYGLCVLSIILIIFIAYLQLKINKSNLRQWCTLILVCTLIANIFTMFQIINISNPESVIKYKAFAYIGESMLPICQFFAIAYFIKPDFKFTNKHLTLFYIPIITIISTFSNSYHHLVFDEFSSVLRECKYGVLFYIYIVDVYITYALSLFMLLKYLFKNAKEYITQIIAGTAFFMIPYILHFLSITHVIDAKMYIIEIWQSIASISAIYILLKYQLLVELPISLVSILNTISDAFVVINEKGIIIEYNEVFLSIFGLGKLNIKGMDIIDLIEFKEFDTIDETDIKDLLNIENTKIEHFERSSEFLGKTLKYEFKELKSKKNMNYLISIADITQYSRNIQSIKLNHDAIIGKERLASLGQMIGGIAHNLKTPIFSIAGAIEGIDDLVKEYRESINDEKVTVTDHKEISGEMKEWTGKIKSYLSYMTDIITAIQMQISNDSNQSIDEKFSIKELIKYIEILMKYELKQSQIELKINNQIEEEKSISGNINSLIQVINNLMSNAIQAYSDEENKIIELNLYEKDGKILIEVRDYAGGIPDEIANKLFKEMVTTKGKNGTGLRTVYIIYNNKNWFWRNFIVLYRKRYRNNI